MIGRLPSEVPVSGERYDLTLTGAGLDSRKRELAMFIIDNGDKRSVRVSAYLTPRLKTDLKDFADVEDPSPLELDKRKGTIRVSAIIDCERMTKDGHGIFHPVPDTFKAANVYISYTLRDFGVAENPSELDSMFKRKEQKFTRKPTTKRRAAKPKE